MRIDVETNEEEYSRLSGLTDAEATSDQLVRWVEGQLLEAAAKGAANPARPYTIGGLRAAAHKILARSAVEVARPSVPGEWLDGDQIGKLRAWLLAGDSEARIPVHRGAEVVGYVRVEGDGRLRWEPERPELERHQRRAALVGLREALTLALQAMRALGVTEAELEEVGIHA